MYHVRHARKIRKELHVKSEIDPAQEIRARVDF